MSSSATRGRRRKGADAAGNDGPRLVIVESPAKARTIAGFLGPDYVVESSIGHIRDLPPGNDAVDIEDGFKPRYEIPSDKQAQVRKLRKLTREASELYLATDEDREGEAIAWHLAEVLKPTVPVRRMVFHEITERAIAHALANPRNIDEDLVSAQEARRVLDRLYGYEVSPVLWRKVRPRLSAGRVQSAAIRMIVARERERMRFASASFWDVRSQVRSEQDVPPPEPFATRLAELGGQRLARGNDFAPETGSCARAPRCSRSTRSAHAPSPTRSRRPSTPSSRSTSGPTRSGRRRRSSPPACSRRPGASWASPRSARCAPRRTSTRTASSPTCARTRSTCPTRRSTPHAGRRATSTARTTCPTEPRRYRTRARGAQEAHEAIRPAGDIFRTPDSLRGALRPDELRLYELIWKRTVASQMKDARGRRTRARLLADAGEHGAAVFAVSGKVIDFPGFLRAYVEGSDDPDAALDDQERVLPPLTEGQLLRGVSAEAQGHETRPPARYTEASLVRELEELGIGRPSTYASIIQTVQDRGYVWKQGAALTPTLTAFAVVALLEQHFGDLVDLGFTARMEDDLDRIAEGELEREPWLHRFYFGDDSKDAVGLAAEGLKQRIDSSWEAIDARAISTIPLGKDADGRQIAARVGRYGPYLEVGDGEQRATLPDDQPPDELTIERALELLAQAALGDSVVATEPESDKPIYVKSGPNGPYVQVGENDDNGGKPKRASLWPDMSIETLTAEQALDLLSYPRVLGAHPESGEEIAAQDGRYGPYIRAGKETRSLRDHEHLRVIDLDEAVRLLKEPKRRGRGAAAGPLAVLGDHPESGASIELRNGRYGPYVTDGQVNASLPRGQEPSTVTLENAVDMIAAREERMRAQGQDPRAPKPQRRAKRTGGARRTPKRRSA